jgi:very-short-patch-repair endonuclease
VRSEQQPLHETFHEPLLRTLASSPHVRDDPAVYRDQILLHRARQQRREMNDAEKRLWYRLRRRGLEGFRFRRQVPIGTYIADFACLGARLVIEVDGDSHGNDLAEALDAGRDETIERNGYRVLRFSHYYVLTETGNVVEAVLEALHLAAYLPPSCSTPPPP